MLPDTGLVGATAFAEKLRESLRATMGEVTVSFGVTDARTAGRTVRGMLAQRRRRALRRQAQGPRPRRHAEHAAQWGRGDEVVVPFAPPPRG